MISEDNNNHYCWIKDLSILVSSQINNTEFKKYMCDKCLIYFYSKKVRNAPIKWL